MSPIGSIHQALQGGFLSPRFEDAKVYDAMRLGVIFCRPETRLREVARMMSTYRIHSVVVSDIGLEEQRPWGIVSDFDLAVAAGKDAGERRAREVARSDVVTVGPDEPLARATQLMADHEISHLIVIQPQSGHPLGILSTLDVAAVLAWGETA
jgi:CBS domain-containing protein